MPQYTEQQTEKALQNLPEELQEALFSMDTAKHIWDARERHNLADEKYDQVPTHVGYVLMGLMLPQEFREVLEKELGVPKKTAEQIAREINRFIFYPVKPALEQLHKMELGVSAKVMPQKEQATEKPPQQEPPQSGGGQDTYREPIE